MRTMTPNPQTFEPQYDVIERPDQVQIYGSIMGKMVGALLRDAAERVG